MSARNSRDPSPAQPGIRPNGGRCGGRGAIKGKIVPQPPTRVSFETARSERHTDSEKSQCVEVGWTVKEARKNVA